MAKRAPKPPNDGASEKDIQNWLQALIAKDQLSAAIDGKPALETALQSSSAGNWWPSFPIDYLSRLRTLQSAKAILGKLSGLELVSTSVKSISRTKYESLFVDLLYAVPEGSRFVAIEVKRDRATARETITELLAYEHEILNHIPFASAHDILMVVVSRDFSPLLDHAITGLITWGRKRILCLKVCDSEKGRHLAIHLPKAWEAVGQKTFPATGIQTAYLCPYPNEKLSADQVYEICETALNIMAREAERAGASGFGMVVQDHFYPGLTDSPYSIVVGAVNPFCFLPDAESKGLVAADASILSAFLLSEDKREELTLSWEWITADEGATKSYLNQFGSPMWEGFSDWNSFRDPRRWRSNSVTADRHIRPVRFEFWGVLGDYARDVVIHRERMKSFIPGYCKPGMDWRHPHLGTLILDDVSIPPVVHGGEWTFAAIFAFGIRLGRFGSIAATFAGADEENKRKLRAGLFWAEADLQWITTEVALRYISAKEIKKAPPVIPIGNYESPAAVLKRTTEFANWFAHHFIGSSSPFMQHGFQTALDTYWLYDEQFAGEGAAMSAARQEAGENARTWLTITVEAFYGDDMSDRDRKRLLVLVKRAFGDALPLAKSKKSALSAVAALEEAILLDTLFAEIPAMVNTWHPQLAHTLAPMSDTNRDWDWYREQIRASRARGVKNPCIFLSAGGQMGVGSLPDDVPVPMIEDPEEEVLFVDNQTFAELTFRVKWADLIAGRVPSVRNAKKKKR